MPIELHNSKWGSVKDVPGVESKGHRRATEIISAIATCLDCDAAWTATPSPDNSPQSGHFITGSGVIEVMCPNGHADIKSMGPLLPDPR